MNWGGEMLDLLKDVKQTALQTGEKAIRLLFEIAAVASERFRPGAAEPERAPVDFYHEPYQPPVTAPRVVEAAPEPVPPQPATRTMSPAKARKKAVKARRAPAKRRGKKRPDQMIRVLELLEISEKPWLSAKELSDAGAAAGTPILPGNVRKVIRARGGDSVDTRPRDGSRRGALEYRISAAGKALLSS